MACTLQGNAMLTTPRLHLRKFQAADLENLFRLLSSDEVMAQLEAPYSHEQTEDFLQQCGLSDNPLIYAVDDDCGAFVGYVIYHPYDAESYEIGWVLLPCHWGKGYASELTQRLIEDARHRTNRLIIECVPSQAATRRIAQKHHFIFVGRRDGLEVYELCLHRCRPHPPLH